jgi:hypothetical protein
VLGRRADSADSTKQVQKISNTPIPVKTGGHAQLLSNLAAVSHSTQSVVANQSRRPTGVWRRQENNPTVPVQNPTMTLLKDKSSLLWQRDVASVFAMTTGWGDRSELEMSLQWLATFKCSQKLFVYTCSKWQEAVLDQIRAALFRYPYHIAGEQYFFMNLAGPENRGIAIQMEHQTRYEPRATTRD